MKCSDTVIHLLQLINKYIYIFMLLTIFRIGLQNIQKQKFSVHYANWLFLSFFTLTVYVQTVTLTRFGLAYYFPTITITMCRFSDIVLLSKLNYNIACICNLKFWASHRQRATLLVCLLWLYATKQVLSHSKSLEPLAAWLHYNWGRTYRHKISLHLEYVYTP